MLLFCRASIRHSWNRMAVANCSSRQSCQNLHTAGIIVIGDEVLKGYTKDTNSHFLAQRLFDLGVKVERISVISDDLDIIASEVNHFSTTYHHVITSGGVGPTHDDLTYEGVARAFGEHADYNEELLGIIQGFFKIKRDSKSPLLKLAKIPKSAQLIYGTHPTSGQRSPYPVVRVRNVTVFPGIPKLLRRAFIMIESDFKNSDSSFTSEAVFLDCNEFEIADILTDVQTEFGKLVNVGSYPKIGHSYYSVKVMLDSRSKEAVQKARAKLLAEVPPSSVVHFDVAPLEGVVEKYDQFLESLRARSDNMAAKLDKSTNLINQALDTYGLDKMCICFNGGKDCTALLHLLHVLRSKRPDLADMKIKALHIQNDETFPELTEFIDEAATRYFLELITIRNDIKTALSQLQSSHPEIKAVLMGTRLADLKQPLDDFAMTDEGWPPYMRVSPFLDWGYADIWRFLRGLWLPYCSLYDKGYTSLGKRSTTFKNPALKFVDGFGLERHRPAFTLEDHHLERSSRM